MQLLMLSGNSLRNRDWIHEVDQQFNGLFTATYIQGYRHWQTEGDWIDLSYELSVLREQAKDSQEQPYGVFAKSIGTVLALQAIQKKIIQPKFLLFCGVPLNFIIENYSQFTDELKACKIPILFIHNENDVVGSAEELKQYLGEELAKNVIVTPGSTHDYEDYTLLKSEIMKLRGVA